MTIVKFLLARIAEDERDARAIRDAEWYHGVESDAESEVLRLSDPDRLLAECQAKRAIIAEYDAFDGYDVWSMAVRHLAAAHADHPDYDPAWAITP